MQHVQGNGLVPALVQTLATYLGEEEARRRVVTHSIPLGASGYALHRNRGVLQSLGLDKDEATRCLADIGKQAMHAALNIARLGVYWRAGTSG